MREVAGALERPADCEIVIEPGKAGIWIRIPSPRLPWPVYVGAVAAVVSLGAVITAGAMVFLLKMPFPGYASIVGERFSPQPAAWRLAGLLGWLLITSALIALTAASFRPITRAESVFIPSLSGAARDLPLVFYARELGIQRSKELSINDVLRFELNRDPQELMESKIVVETHSALAQRGGARRLTVAGNIGEAEREWLVSVLNALLQEARGY